MTMYTDFQETRYMDIYKYLSDNGVEVYTPSQKKGECTKPYVVVKTQGTDKYLQYSSTRTLYDLMCYVPKDHYTRLEPFVEKVKNLMRDLQPMIMPTYTETPAFYDDTVKAHMISIQYRNYRKIV